MNLAGWSVKTSWLGGDPDFAGRWVLEKKWWDSKEVHPIYSDSFQIKRKLETQVLLKWNMKFIFKLLWLPQTPSNYDWLTRWVWLLEGGVPVLGQCYRYLFSSDDLGQRHCPCQEQGSYGVFRENSAQMLQTPKMPGMKLLQSSHLLQHLNRERFRSWEIPGVEQGMFCINPFLLCSFFRKSQSQDKQSKGLSIWPWSMDGSHNFPYRYL